MKKTYITSFITIFFLAFISVAFAAFNSELTITGEATVLTDTTPPTCGSWYLRDSSLTTQQAYDQNKFINAGSNTTWTNTNKTLFIECTDNMDGEYGCINVDAVNTTGGKRYFKDVKDYTTSIKTDNNTVTVTLKDAYQNERTCTLPVGGSNPYVDKQGPTVTITRTAANKFTYSATDDMSSVVTTQYMVTTSSTQPSINDSGWSTTASEVTIDQTAAKTYYVWAKDGVNITHQTINTYKLTKTQGTGTTLTLKYNNNSGAELNTSYVLAGTPVYVTASANNGYGSLVFKKDGTSISSGSTQTISGATTISSSATPNIYSITLNNQSATSGGTAKVWYKFNTVTDGCYYYTDSTLSTCLTNYTITKPTKTGYTYGGYYTSTNGVGTNYINTDGVFINNIYQKTPNQINSSYTTDITLYAKWTAKTYTLNLNKNDGTGAGTTSLTATYNSSAISQSSMTLASKSFTISGFGTAAARKSDGATVSSTSTLTSTATLNGYYTASTGGSLIVAANTTPTFNNATVSGYLSSGAWVRDSNTTLYAQFGAMPSKTLPTITKTGYTCGWTTSESGTTIQYQSGGNLIPTGNTTLYGVCTADTYTITYELNGGSQSNPKTTYNVETDTFTLVNPTKTGFTFEGWTGSNGSTLQKTVTITKGTTGNKTYTAHWGYYVEIYGSGYNQPSTKVHKVMIAGTQANTTSGRGLTVVKFNKLTGAVIHTASYDTYADDSARTDVASIINNSTNSELIAIFSQDATSFNTNLKTALTSAGIPSDRIYYANSSGRYPTAIFVGKGLTSSQAGMVEAFTEEFAPVSYLRIYVKDGVPQRETYSITYTLNGGTFEAAYPTYFDVSTTTFNLVNPTRTGYTFAGWTGSNGTTAQTTVSIAKGSSGDRVYTANWTPNIYTITLDRQSGSGGSDYVYEKYNTGYYTNSTATTQMTTSANPITAPTKTGYTFGGYYTSTGGAGTQYIDANGKLTSSASSTQFSANDSLYAKWTANSYTVVYNKSNSNETGTLPSNQSATYDTAFTLGSNSMSRPNSGNSDSYTLTFLKGTASSAAPSAITNTKYYSYTANGWATSANGAQAYTSGQTNVKNLTATAGGTYNLYTSWSATTHQNAITLPAAATKNNTNLGTVTFKYQDGATADTTSTAYNTYAFSGWYDAETGGNKLGNAGASYTPNASKNVYPQFTATAHSATFPAPTRNGYTFAGWFTAETGGTQVTTYTGSSNVTYYAHWTGNTYYVYYNQGLATGGWSTSTYATQSRTFPGSTTLRTNSMTKTATTANSYTVTYNQGTATGGWDATTYGTQTSINTTSYTADGWSTGSTNLNDRDYSNGASYGANSTANLTLYPNFSTSTTNGGVTTRTNSMTKSNSADSNSYTLTFKQGDASSAAPSAITNKKYTSYTANGWTTTSGSTTKTHNNNTATGALTGNITLYPCFSETVNQKSITLPAAATKNNTNLGTVTFKYKDNATADTTSTAYNTYAFKGWYTASSGGTKLGDANASYTPNASIDVYPQFTSTAHSATFPSPSRTGYTFAGWYDAETGGNKVTTYTGSSNVTYYAHWTPISYTVVYNKSNSNETGSLPANQLATYDTTFTIGTNSMSRPNSSDTDSYTLTFKQGVATSSAPAAITNKKYTSYTANGWATSANGSRAYTSGQTGVKNLTTTNNATVNLYTSWSSQVNQRSITLPSAATKSNTNLGTVTFNYNGSGAASTTSTGYTTYAFKGWYTDQTGGNKVGDAGATYTPTASIDVYPQFSSTAHSATFPSSPTRTGYTFAGWWTAASGGTQVTSYTGTSAVEYFAHWTPNTYYVYYNQGLATGGWNTTTYATQSRTYPNSTTLRTNSMTKSNTTANSYTVTYEQGSATGGWNASTYAAQTSTNTTTYTANGWTTGSTNLNDPDYANGASYGANSTANLTLYPNFTSSTTNGGVITRTNNMTISDSDPIPGPYVIFITESDEFSIPATRYSTFTAVGWFVKGSGNIHYDNNVSTGALTSNITLVPAFVGGTIINPITLPAAATKVNTNLGTVTFNYNGSGAAATTSTAYTTYAFSGWYDAETGGNKLGNAGDSYTPKTPNNEYAYPQFTSTAHSATFPSNPTRTGYTFAGWYTAASGGTQVTSYTGSSNVEYYAHWTPITYTIAYTMNNGTDPNPKPTSGTYDSNVSIGTTSIPTKTVTITGNANGTGAAVGAAKVNALTFNGWSSSSGAGLQGNAQSGSTTSNFASWTGGTTTNKYFKNLRNGSGTVTLTANWSTTVTLPTLSKTGHTCSWTDANGNAFGTTISQNASTSITVYAKCTANTYNITLNQQGGSGGTGTIYEKYGDGYYLNNSGGTVSNKMSTSANGVTVPTRSGYTFGGYYTSTNGGGTQYIDANGKLTSSASATQFSAAGNLYAKWTLNTPATPTISGGATKVYGSSSTTLTCSNSTTYPSGITKKYQFGYASSDGGSPGNWTTESDSNTLTIAANAYVEQRWYSCRVRVYDGSAYSGYATSSTSADTEMTINNATLTFDANNGTGGGTVYTKTGQNVVYDGIRSTSTTSIPTPSRPGYVFDGWYDAPSGGNRVLNADGSFTGTAVSGYTSTNTWVATTNKTLYAYWDGLLYTVTFHYGDTQKNDIPYTSSNTYQTITIPVTGKYRLEAWGAQGGSSVNNGGESYSAGGKGAYTAGTASFNQNETLYAYVGQKPGYVSSGKADNPGGWNGGGTGRWDHGDNDSSGGGGGATDFRYFGSDTPNLTVNNAVSLRYRIMVAGGGSGNAWSGNPGHAGALESLPRGRATAATQTTGYSFGVGGTSSVTGKTKVGNTGGGGGYWGGRPGGARSGNTDDSGQGTGGSSYVSGYTGAVAVRDNSVNTPRYASDGTTVCANGTTDNTCSIHFTGKVFEDPVMISGEPAPAEVVGTDEESEYIMKDPDGIEVYGHAGNGHARISLDSVQKQVISGQVIGSPPLPYNSDTYWGIEEEEGEDEEGVPFYYSYNVEYDINWAYKGFVETEDEEGNPIYMEEDIPIDLNETYDTLYGTDFYAYGTPHEYSITYRDVSEAQWTSGSGSSAHYIEHPSHYNSLDEITIPNPISGMYSGTYYKFLGWTAQYNISPTQSFEINKGDSGDLELTANWETKSTFTVQYNANGGTTTCSTTSGSYGVSWELCDDGATYGNVQFLGWFTKPSGGKNVGIDDSVSRLYGYGDNEGDYILYAHWDIDAIEYDYNITQSFAANRMINTYYAPDWTKTFEVEIKFSVSTASKRYLLFGNYDNSATNALNIEVAQNNTMRVYVGKGSTNTTFGSVSTNQEITVKALWNGTTKKLTVDVTGGGTGHYEGTLTALANISGKTNRAFRFGASDYRASTTPFNTINVKDFVIREFYGKPLQDTITVPDPAGHYLLFDGWTGPNGDTPQYNLTVPINSTGLISYTANWSTGVSFKGYSKTFSTSNENIKFKNEVTVVYIDQARRYAYTRERVYFYRTNDASPNGTYGQGSMTVRYNWSAGYKDWTVNLAEKHIKQSGINLWSENWNAYSIGYRTIPYLDNGTRSVTLGVKNFTHVRFSVSTPKNATFALPAIKAKPTQ